LVAASRARLEWLHTAILLGGEAGLRQGEILALEWRDLDFGSANLRIIRSSWKGVVGSTKGGRARVVPITRRLLTALEQQRAQQRGPLVVSAGGGEPLHFSRMTYRLYELCEAANLRRVGWHVLRHTFCSHLAMRGAPPAAIQALAGHESVETTQRYLHLAPVVLRETMRLLEGREGTPRIETELET
jgi:integrase